MVDILDGQPNWTMPYIELQVRELHDTALEHSWMKMHVEHRQHANACQALLCVQKKVDVHLANQGRDLPVPTPHP
jgi:hypothetical protein